MWLAVALWCSYMDAAQRSDQGAQGAAVLTAYRQAEEEEAARLHSLRAAGAVDDRQYVLVDWDGMQFSPHRRPVWNTIFIIAQVGL